MGRRGDYLKRKSRLCESMLLLLQNPTKSVDKEGSGKSGWRNAEVPKK